MANFEDKIEEMYIDLPEPPEEIEGTSPISKSGKLVYVSGQLPYSEGRRLLHRGRLGLELNLDAGCAAARAAVIQTLSVLKKNLGTLNKIKRIVHLKVYVATGAEFKEHKKVAASAMELLREIFGTFAKCSVEVVGCASLPEGAAVELSFVIEVK